MIISVLKALLAILLFICLFQKKSTMPVVPLRAYMDIFALPIAFILIVKTLSHLEIQNIAILNEILNTLNDPFLIFPLIVTWLTFVFIVILTLKIFTDIIHGNIWDRLYNIFKLKEYRKRVRNIIKRLKIFVMCLIKILTVSVLIYLIYTQLDIAILQNLVDTTINSTETQIQAGNVKDRTASTELDLALLAAIVAGYIALYNLQRTLKQELTRNRQKWIDSVRYETATMISIVDQIVMYRRCDFEHHYVEKTIELHSALLESCAKLRMLLNPNDHLSPILMIQLDKLMDYASCREGSSVCLEQINLKKSFMPWVQILLKIEWERVKAILESREKQQPDYYSKNIYGDEWDGNKVYNYVVSESTCQKKKVTVDDVKKSLNGFGFNLNAQYIKSALDNIEDIIE